MCISKIGRMTHVLQWNRPLLVHMMACRLFEAKPFSEPMRNRNKTILTQENWFEIVVWVEEAILYLPTRVVNGVHLSHFSGPLFTLAVRRLTARSREVSKPRDPGWDLSYSCEICHALRQHGCRGASQISKRYYYYNPQSRGSETSRDLAVIRLIA